MEGSPWNGDEFLISRKPVGVSVRYGQNIQVCTSRNVEELQVEGSHWDEQRVWAKTRFITFALATHVS